MRSLAILFAFLLSACTSLLIQQDDPMHLIAAKGIWRAALAVPTLGFSEVRMSALREAANTELAAEQRLEDYEFHLTYLVNNGALSQSEAEDLYQKYAALLWQQTLDVVGGVEPAYFPSPYGSYGAGGWYDPPWYSSVNGPYGRNGLQWSSHSRFARISGLARSRMGIPRWSRGIGGKGTYGRIGGNTRGGGRRGGRR
jgi:hypothetical protein